jgi:hypothetical protein
MAALPARAPRFGIFPLALGGIALLYATFSLGVAELPAWPAASAGILAIAWATLPGHALARGGGAFLGTLGLVVGSVRIAALFGLAALGS